MSTAYWLLLLGLTGLVVLVGLIVGLLAAAPRLIATGMIVAELLPAKGQVQPRPPAPVPTPAHKTIRMSVLSLESNDLVLTPSTPFRFRMEKVLWREQQPYGPVVAVLEGTDPDSLQTQQRWHQWRPQEMVTVLTGPVEIEDYSGDYGGLYDKFSADEPPADVGPPPPAAGMELWQSAL